MNTLSPRGDRPLLSVLGLLLLLCTLAAPAQTYVTPMLGGGQVFADMVHIDLFYDSDANQLHATVDDSYGTPVLRPLEPGLTFDLAKPYAVLNGKAYNSQYGWNVGGMYSLPSGSAIWIEMTNSSSVLETYAGFGSTGAYTNIFGTGGSSRIWKWGGTMIHNTYAVLDPPVSRVFADYHIFFGDAETGSRTGFTQYDDTNVRLVWDVVPVENPLTLKFGALAQTNGAPLAFLNAVDFVTNSQTVLNFRLTTMGLSAMPYQASIPLMSVPATVLNGGPFTTPAALGSCLELQLVSLSGPANGCLGFRERGDVLPTFVVPVGETAGTNRVRLTENYGSADRDPYGRIPGRQFGLAQAGLYCLGLRLVDTSTNGPGNGPIHAASPVYRVYLQAGVTIASISRTDATASVSFGGVPGANFWLERCVQLGAAASWQDVAGPLTGTNRLQSLTDPAPPSGRAFYRLNLR